MQDGHVRFSAPSVATGCAGRQHAGRFQLDWSRGHDVSTTTTTKPVALTQVSASAPATRAPAIKQTVVEDLAEIVRETRTSIDLLQQLALRDIRIRYKQALFGFAWALLVPMAVVISGLVMRVAFSYASNRPLDWSQVAGMVVKAVPWSFFVGCLNAGTQSLVANKALVTKVYFPREVLPLSSVLAQTFDSLIGLSLVAIILPFVGIDASWQLLWLPLLLVTLWTLALAAALFLGCANLFFRDVKYLVQIFLTFGIFVTPVIFDAQMFGPTIGRLMMLNPVAPILEGLRLSVVYNQNLLQTLSTPQGAVYWQPAYLAYSMVWAFGGLLVASLIFHRSERRFAEVS
jgi:lipopolysaccharide transport system permease protein